MPGRPQTCILIAECRCVAVWRSTVLRWGTVSREPRTPNTPDDDDDVDHCSTFHCRTPADVVDDDDVTVPSALTAVVLPCQDVVPRAPRTPSSLDTVHPPSHRLCLSTPRQPCLELYPVPVDGRPEVVVDCSHSVGLDVPTHWIHRRRSHRDIMTLTHLTLFVVPVDQQLQWTARPDRQTVLLGWLCRCPADYRRRSFHGTTWTTVTVAVCHIHLSINSAHLPSMMTY